MTDRLPAPGPADPQPADPQPSGPPPDSWDALARVLSGEPAPADADGAARDAAARQWLAAHPAETARLAALDRMLAQIDPAPAAAPPVDVEAALARVTARRLAAEPTSIAPPSAAMPPRVARPAVAAPRWVGRGGASGRWRQRGVLAGAAVALVMGGAVWQLSRRATAPQLTTDAALPRQQYATAVGERRAIQLADGSDVVLGPASTLVVPAGYGAAARRVTLDGEGYFRVRHDDARPFVVRAGPATVHDLGTAFAVRHAAGGDVTVAVTEGVVRLATAVDAPGAPPTGDTLPAVTPPPDRRASGTGRDLRSRSADSSVVLRAGQRGVVTRSLDAAGRAGRLTARALPTASVADDTAWTTGRLVFRDAPLPEVADALRRWYGVDLRVTDPALAGRHLTASFRGEPVDSVLRVVGLALGATLERTGAAVTIRVAP